jgi:26S proteasome regulatory subunit N13
VKVDQVNTGRVYVLKFSSSNQRHFVSPDPIFFVNLSSCLLVLAASAIFTYSTNQLVLIVVYQDASSSRDSEFIENLNGLLQDPDYDLRWTIPITSAQPAAST